MTKQGIVYIAVDSRDYLEMALLSIESLIANGLKDDVCIVTNLLEHDTVCRDLQIKVKPVSNRYTYRFFSRYLKTRLPKLTPFNRTLYLDCDVKANKEFSGIWEFDSLAMTKCYNPIIADCKHINLDEKSFTIDKLGVVYPQYNSGVILFDDSAAGLFSKWNHQWNLYARHDQLALSRAVAATETNVNVLPQIYNTLAQNKTKDSVFVHHAGLDKSNFYARFY